MKIFLSVLFIAIAQNFCIAQTNLFPDTGKVGIGTLTPRNSLEISGTKSILSIVSTKHTEAMSNNEVLGGIDFYKHYGLANGASIKFLHAGGPDYYSMTHLAFYTAAGGNPYNTIPNERMRITSTGDVAIGTIDPKGYKLAVAGNMIAESVKVQLQSSWPDFVFAKSYRLPTLQETETHIKEKGYLPGIPSATEVKANGIDLGEMNAKLLQKIEELTLQVIELSKQNKTQNEAQQKEINYLKSKLK